MRINKILLVFIISIMFIPFVVNAEACENDKISIELIEIKNISDNVVEKTEPVINGMGVKLDLEMSEVDDSIEYEMTIKNDSNTDYKLDKNSLNIESDYIDYTFETKDKTNIIKAKSSSEAVLTVQYSNEVPEGLLENGSFIDKKTISIGLNDGKNDITSILTNPKTGQSLLSLIIMLLIIGSVSLIILKKNKKIGTLVLLLGLASLPFSVFALCSLNLKVESNVEIKDLSCIMFDDDTSWNTIIDAVHNNYTSCMNVGDTKTVDMGNYGTHKLRIVNMSISDRCDETGYSQTACGFVVEFEDIITEHVMTGANYNYGGWANSSMRTFVNEEIYNLLPEELKDNILDTYVVSGHGKGEVDNHITIDKLYLLSPKEVFNGVGLFNPPMTDTAADLTRQLDYYSNHGVMYSELNDVAIKLYNGIDTTWWLRTAVYDRIAGFFASQTGGFQGAQVSEYAYVEYGVSPAFRIG